MWAVWVIVGCLAAGALAGLVGGRDADREKKRQEKELMEGGVAPFLQMESTVVEKKMEKQMTGTYFEPGHRIIYWMKFLFGEIEEVLLEVPTSVYESLPIGSTGSLVMQDGNFVGFDSDRV